MLVNGQDVARLRRRKIPYLRRQMGIIFQDFRLIPTMTVYENIAFAMHVTNIGHKQIKERVNYMLELVHLEDKAKVYPDLLSGGEQQRVAVARALAHAPKLVIADEPTGNIDPELSLEMMELLERVSEMGITVLVVTHEHELVRHFDRRVVTLSGGHIISDVPTGSMIPHPPVDPKELERELSLVDEAFYVRFPCGARRAQPGQALGHDHCLHRFFECLYDPEYLCQSGRGECGQHGGLSGQPERDGGLSGPRM